MSSGFVFWVDKYLSELTDIAVPMFFVISGYLFFQNYTPQKLISKWKSRLFSVLIPYLIWNGLAYLFYVLLNAIPFVSNNINRTIEGFTVIELLKQVFWEDIM